MFRPLAPLSATLNVSATLSAALLALSLGAAPVGAETDLTRLSDTETEALRGEIRTYLLENPEVILEALRVLEDRDAAQQANADSALVDDHADALFSDGYSWVGGNPEGDVTVVEFMDYRCGYCRRAFDEVEELVGGDGNIRFIVKELPILGEASMISSRFAIAAKQVAGDDAYKQVHDAMMHFSGTPDDAALTRIGEGLGLDPAPILAAMDSDDVSREIATTRALAQRMGINGTPTFVMGGELVRGYVPLDTMRGIVETARSE